MAGGVEYYDIQRRERMTLQEILEKCAGLRIDQEICNNELYVELVFFSEEIERWQEVFTEVFGPAIKLSGVEPTEEHLNLTKNYGGVLGGILSDQTLFEKTFNGCTIIAMFWPWHSYTEEDEEGKVTLKMAVLRKVKC